MLTRSTSPNFRLFSCTKLVSLFSKPLPKLGFLTPSIAKRETINAALEGQVSELCGFSTLGELRDAPDLSSMDLLVIDLSSDRESKLRFAQAIQEYQAVKMCAIGPANASDLRKRARAHGFAQYLQEPIKPATLAKTLADIWHGGAASSRSKPTPTAANASAQRLAERLGQTKA